MRSILGFFLLAGGVMAEGGAPAFRITGEAGRIPTIVTAAHPTASARLAALELQYHIEKITGVRLVVVGDERDIRTPTILVGESALTRKLGLRGSDFASQEYLIRIEPTQVVLMGKDWEDTRANRAEAGVDTNFDSLANQRVRVNYLAAVADGVSEKRVAEPVTLPGPYDDQGTCYAVYDFLERFGGVRWFGPGAQEMSFVPQAKWELVTTEIRRSPAMKYRMGTPTWDWPIMKAQWGDPGTEAVALYERRLRVGGEKWAANHSFRSYHDRFWEKNPVHPEFYAGHRAEYFAQGRTGGGDSRQLCYTNPALIQQVVQDARDYFDGRGLKGQQVAMGDYFTLVPLDNDAWCQCDACQKLLALDRDNFLGEHFNSGRASHYWFTFVNAVARELARTHPGKRIATLAYHGYAIRPTDLAIEPNVAVAPCLQVRNYWAPRIAEHERAIYESWTKPGDRPIHVWNYYCFPEEPGFLTGKWKCFPGFSAHLLGEQIKRYAHDGVHGVFLCGLGEQLDFYLTMKLYDDPSASVDALVDEFFVRYFGAAAEPMHRFYRKIEETFSDPRSYPPELIGAEKQLHQTEEIAWKYLGTEECMNVLGGLMAEAEALARTPEEKVRVGLWKTGVWQHMRDGRRLYLEHGRSLMAPAKT